MGHKPKSNDSKGRISSDLASDFLHLYQAHAHLHEVLSLCSTYLCMRSIYIAFIYSPSPNCIGHSLSHCQQNSNTNTSNGLMSSLSWGIFQHEPWILMMFAWFRFQGWPSRAISDPRVWKPLRESLNSICSNASLRSVVILIYVRRRAVAYIIHRWQPGNWKQIDSAPLRNSRERKEVPRQGWSWSTFWCSAAIRPAAEGEDAACTCCCPTHCHLIARSTIPTKSTTTVKIVASIRQL